MADFFLSKILGQASASLDVHHLTSLDPVLHKNLLYLRHYDGDVTELGLDFTIVSSELGETKVIDIISDDFLSRSPLLFFWYKF